VSTRGLRQGLRGAAGSILVIALCVLGGRVTSADPLTDVFTVRNVPVDETARTAAAARAESIRRGQRQALNFLFQRIVLRADDELLPVLPDEEVTALAQGFEVRNEKTSSTRYLANLTIKFKKDDIRALLRREQVSFTETIAKPTLVLPVFAIGANRVLWDDPNPWRRAWALRDPMDDGLLPFVVPFGDLEDLTIIDAEQAIEGDEAALAQIARRYHAEEVLVAHAAVSFEGGLDTPTVQVVLRRYGPLGERVVVEQFTGRRGDQIPVLLQDVANAITVDLEEEWKALTLLDFGTKFALDARIPLAGLGDWLTVRRLLSESAVIQKSQLRSLSLQEARVGIEFVGSSQGLVVALAQRDLDLVYNENLWTLSLRKEQVIESAISVEGAVMLQEAPPVVAPELPHEAALPVALEEVPEFHLDAETITGHQLEMESDDKDIEWRREGDGYHEDDLHPSIESGSDFSSDRTVIFRPLPAAGVDGGEGTPDNVEPPQ
jgi:hypothetical protein